jgi:beta-lactamase class A
MKRCASAFVLLILLIPRPLPAADLLELKAAFDKIVRTARANVGVSLIHLETGSKVDIQGDRRFPMASVYKLPIAVELLAQVALGKVTLDKAVWIAESDVRACCTISRHHPHGGVSMTVGELLELMIVESDNTSADVLLKLVGGPPAVQRRLRSLGYADTIRVDRYEGDINFEMTGVENPPPQGEWTLELQHRLISEISPEALRDARARYLQDPRDSAMPNEMARFLAELYAGLLLPRTLTAQLVDMMSRSKTGPQRLKALLPAETVVAHKTGTTTVVINDVGLITLPDDSAIPGHFAIAVFVTDGRIRSMQQTIAKLSGAAFEYFTGRPLPKPQHRPSSIGHGPSSGRRSSARRSSGRPSPGPHQSGSEASAPIDDGRSTMDDPGTKN